MGGGGESGGSWRDWRGSWRERGKEEGEVGEEEQGWKRGGEEGRYGHKSLTKIVNRINVTAHCVWRKV